MTKKIILSFIIGAAFFLGWHFLMGLHWSRESSFDIISGAIVEFFLFQLLLHIHSMKQNRDFQKHLEDHLNKIEALIKRTNALEKNRGENKCTKPSP